MRLWQYWLQSKILLSFGKQRLKCASWSLLIRITSGRHFNRKVNNKLLHDLIFNDFPSSSLNVEILTLNVIIYIQKRSVCVNYKNVNNEIIDFVQIKSGWVLSLGLFFQIKSISKIRHLSLLQHFLWILSLHTELCSFDSQNVSLLWNLYAHHHAGGGDHTCNRYSLYCTNHIEIHRLPSVG